MGRDPGADLLAGIVGGGAMRDLAQRHLLDEADVDAFVEGEAHQVEDLVAVALAQNDGVEFDAVEAGGDGGVDARQHPVQIAIAGQEAEALGVQGVEADVDAPHPGGADGVGAGGKLGAVGGEDQFRQAGQGVDGAQELDQVGPHQGFAAGQAHLAHSQADKGAGHC